jgi:hypothetical protein
VTKVLIKVKYNKFIKKYYFAGLCKKRYRIFNILLFYFLEKMLIKEVPKMKSLLEKMEKEGVEDSMYSLDRISLWAFLLLGVIIGIDVISLLEECNYFSDKNEKYLMIKNCVLLMVTFFCFVYSFLIRRKLILNEGKIIEQEKINKTLLNVNDELKCFKHDFYNILQ